MLLVMSLLPDRLAAGPVTLHRWSLERLDDLMHALEVSVAELQPWMPWMNPMPTRAAEAAALDAGRRAFDADGDWGYFMVETATNQFVGGCGLHKRAGRDTIEIGYWVRSDRTGRGYATATARALTEAAFTYLPFVDYVEIQMDKANAASAAIPPKLGFQFKGEFERERLAPGHTGRGLVWVVNRRNR